MWSTPATAATRTPTQGLLDMYTIRHFKKDFTQLTVAIVGDIVHSRVARSDIHALTTLGVPEIRAVGPKTLVPGDIAAMGVRVCHDMAEGIRDADVIIMLRLQNERMSGAMLPSAGEFFKSYGLTPEKLALAKPDAIVMHPGPINRGVEIASAVADGKASVILPQVTFGIAVRMAVMSTIAGNIAHPRSGFAAPPQGGDASGPAEPVPRRPPDGASGARP